ncbi:ENHANCED DISEASE RESISTANCE-RELATED [Salix purpurea]|uniref:ENHANCED DISEASE RESISTANCE-RELATED n=1 Tax=Salix purpurea TaxID=77065 RepID=A0A9Q0ZEQ2_SALPP|nr:ENHANCED DISEASE RESISTANCE-RELATED [Salix purpurea]
METTTAKTTKVKVRIVERGGGSDGSSGSGGSSGDGSGGGGGKRGGCMCIQVDLNAAVGLLEALRCIDVGIAPAVKLALQCEVKWFNLKHIRKGVIGPTLMVEELGRRKINNGDIYVLRFYNRLDETKKGEIACATAGEVKQWMEAFDQGKQQAEFELARGLSASNKLNMETEIINLDGHRPRVRRYAYGLKKLVRIGQGPETLLRQSSSVAAKVRPDRYSEGEVGDAIDFHQWKCVRTVNGVRIFEDVSNAKSGKGVLVKAVSVIEASADAVFEVILNLDQHQRYEWDMLTGDLELLDSYDGHYDVVYGTCDSKYLSRWKSNRDFVFSRQWFQGQDGTYTILQLPAVHKKRPSRSGYQREKINPSTWEIRDLNTPTESNTARCLVMLMLEIQEGWCRWKKSHGSKFEKTIPFALLSQVEGLKEYIAANPAFKFEHSATVLQSSISDGAISGSEYEDSEVQDEFYDAMADDSSSSSSSEESDDDHEKTKKVKVKLRNVSWAISSLTMMRASDPDASKDLDRFVAPINIDPSQFHGSLNKGKDENDSNCWTSPSGTGFMVRGKTYLKDSFKVMGGDPLLKLISVDWFKVDKAIDGISLHPRCLVQTEAGKKAPLHSGRQSPVNVVGQKVLFRFKMMKDVLDHTFIPSKPNYSLVLYYAADRPINKSSLLGKFVDGTDLFRDSRFKLIPSIIEGYWMVKRAVGTKACLLGKAVTCKYLRQDNFLEIAVDIGSSSVARGVIGLVLGYVTSIVVDLAILIEAKEEADLPEYILGTVRLNRLRIDTAVPFEV